MKNSFPLLRFMNDSTLCLVIDGWKWLMARAVRSSHLVLIIRSNIKTIAQPLYHFINDYSRSLNENETLRKNVNICWNNKTGAADNNGEDFATRALHCLSTNARRGLIIFLVFRALWLHLLFPFRWRHRVAFKAVDHHPDRFTCGHHKRLRFSFLRLDAN